MRILVKAAWKTMILMVFAKHMAAHTDYYLSNEKMTQDDANSSCALATPEIKFTKKGYIVHLHLDDMNLLKDEVIWTGYSQDFHAFQYAGCNKIKRKHSNKFTNPCSIGKCYYACRTTFIGVGVGKKTSNWRCYCYNRSPELSAESGCNSTCDGNKPCGSQGFVSVYKYVGKPKSPTVETACLAYYPEAGSVWNDCGEKMHTRITCKEDVNNNVSEAVIETNVTWRNAMETCLNSGEYPVTEEYAREAIEEESLGIWTGQLYSRSLTEDSPNPTGFLERKKGSDSVFILKFRVATNLKSGRPLCLKATEMTPTEMTGDKKKKRKGLATILTSIFVFTLVALLAILAIALLLFWRRKRIGATTPRGTEEYRQIALRNNKRTRTVTNAMYAVESLDQVSELSDQSTYQTLEPTYEEINIDVNRQHSDRHSQDNYRGYGHGQLEPMHEQPDVVESHEDPDGMPSVNVAHHVLSESSYKQDDVEEHLNDRHSNVAFHDYHILEPKNEQSDALEIPEHLEGKLPVLVVEHLTSGSSYGQVDMCADASEYSVEHTVQCNENKK